MQNLSKFFVVCALGACAAQNNAAVHHGTGSNGSDDGSDGMDAGVGSGSDTGSGSGSGSAVPPPPGTLYGSVFDERDDKIDFSTGEPVHTHQGATIDLSQGCPAVYKYAYLEDAADPTFGSQTNANPLEWFVKSQVGSLDDSATAYRVRLDDGTVALDWTTASAPDGNGTYTVRLYRNGSPSIAQLGDHTGKMYVDMRFRDTSGNETVDTACWENHPMAAPLEVQPIATADLFGWTLPAHSPISTAINTASIDGGGQETLGATVYTQTIVQHTAEPVTLHIDHGAIGAIYSNSLYTGNVVTQQLLDLVDCTESVSAGCLFFLNRPTTTTASGTLAADWNMHVEDNTNAIICHNPDSPGSQTTAIDDCVIPARLANEPPHVYRLIYAMSNATSLDPSPGTTISELALASPGGGTTYLTGAALGTAESCNHINTSSDSCGNESVHTNFAALDGATLALDPFSEIVQTAPDANASLEPIAGYATPSLAMTAQSWDAGSGGF